jgi:nucleoside triphosphate pyrophosphatase
MLSPPELILASTSPRRHLLLGLLGLEFQIIPSGVDESLLPAPSPREFARIAARAKCLDVADRVGNGACVIGADTVVHFQDLDGKDVILGKPTDPSDACRILARLAGRTHRVTTGVALRLSDGTVRVDSNTSRVRFRPMSSEEIADYVATGESLDKAGAYAVQGRGADFIEQVEGDLQNVIGLPLALLVEMLSVDFPGVAMPDPEALARASGTLC